MSNGGGGALPTGPFSNFYYQQYNAMMQEHTGTNSNDSSVIHVVKAANIPSSTTSKCQNRGAAWRPKFAATSDNFYSDFSKKEVNN